MKLKLTNDEDKPINEGEITYGNSSINEVLS